MILWFHGDSMLPNMPKLGLAYSRKTDNYCLGDIICIKAKNEKTYLHRIVKLEEFKVTTKGDNRIKPEEYETGIPLENIVGKVVWHFP